MTAPQWFHAFSSADHVLNRTIQLGQLLAALEDMKKERGAEFVVPNGFGSAHCYKGYYSVLAFVPQSNVPINDLLSLARRCVGKAFKMEKEKFTMNEQTPCVWASAGIANAVAIVPERLLDKS